VVERGEILVRGIDLMNDTPVLDIKPYVAAFDAFPAAAAGWMDLINPNASESRLTGYQTIRYYLNISYLLLFIILNLVPYVRTSIFRFTGRLEERERPDSKEKLRRRLPDPMIVIVALI